MKSRCYYKGNNRYEYYGGRGIVVCDEWKNNFIAFYEWAMSNGYSDELSIDRIDLNGNYEPSNCRWATKVEQANNKSNNRFITFNNQTHTASQWAKITGIKEATIRYRIIHSNWNVERALTTPVRNAKKGAKK
jgi:Fic family protein